MGGHAANRDDEATRRASLSTQEQTIGRSDAGASGWAGSSVKLCIHWKDAGCPQSRNARQKQRHSTHVAAADGRPDDTTRLADVCEQHEAQSRISSGVLRRRRTQDWLKASGG